VQAFLYQFFGLDYGVGMNGKKGFYLDWNPCKFAALSNLRMGP
jgi:hypothetical protein